MKIVCVAIIGKTNNPLFIKTFEQQGDPLRFHYIVHTSLDVVEEKAQIVPNKKSFGELYLGLLCPTEDYKVYGYITNTKNKFILVVDDYDVKEIEIKSFFKIFHGLFTDAVCNPFYTPDENITSKKFTNQVLDLVKKRSPEANV